MIIAITPLWDDLNCSYFLIVFSLIGTPKMSNFSKMDNINKNSFNNLILYELKYLFNILNTHILIMLSTPVCNYDINYINFGYVCSIVD